MGGNRLAPALLATLAGCAFEALVVDNDAECMETCGSGRTCHEGACLKVQGEACAANGECVETCVDSTCAPVSQPGEGCDDSLDCVPQFGCDESLVCKLGDGQLCSFNEDCAGTCVGGSCAPIVAPSGTCDDVDDCGGVALCHEGTCKLPDEELCSTNAECFNVCRAGHCKLPGGLFGDCDEEVDCGEALSCDGFECHWENGHACDANDQCAGVCIYSQCGDPAGTLGECDEALDCQDAHLCDAGVCRRIDGQPCSDNNQCVDVCIEGSCDEPGELGDDCDATDDCQEIYTCAGFTCKLPDGASCSSNTDCVNVCVIGLCAPLAPTGGACDEAADCQELGQICEVGTCGWDLGHFCIDGDECGSRHCANDVCCSTACDGACEDCSDAGACDVMPPDDDVCGVIDCDLRDSACRNYADLSTERCAELGLCKADNSPDCTTYSNAPVGDPCGSSSSLACDAADSCDELGRCIDRKKSEGTTCRPAGAGSCDEAERCDGTSAVCPPPETTVCGVVNYRSIGSAGVLWSGTCVTPTSGTGYDLTPAIDPAIQIGLGDKLTFTFVSTVLYLASVSDSRNHIELQTVAPATSNQCAIARAFNTLQEWETDRETTPENALDLSGDLAGTQRKEVGVVYADAPLHAGVTFDGSTTSAEYHFVLEPAPGHGHQGLPGTGAVLRGLGVSGTGISIFDNFVVLRGLELHDAFGSSGAVWVAASNVTLENLLVHGTAGSIPGIRVSSGDGTVVRNVVVYDVAGDGIFFTASTGSISNCTVYGAVNGVVATSSTVPVTNTLAIGNAVDFQCASQLANMSQDDTGIPYSAVDTSSIFVAPGVGDFHLAPTSPAKDPNTSARNEFAYDFEGDARPAESPWDIGADEAPANDPSSICVGDCGLGYACCCGVCQTESLACPDIVTCGSSEI
jgi:hypothetical protein